MSGLYIHIPFCKQACHYCDFHFSTNQSTTGEMIDAICQELTLQKHYLTTPLASIYLGGGTPSLLSQVELEKLVNTIKSTYSTFDSCEFTVEANPDDLTAEKLRLLRNIGVNRLSIGIQSFDDNILKYLNRSHDVRSAVNCIEIANAAGFSNISLDLIFAIPNQSLSNWQRNIETAISLSPQHISAYSLTIEPDTVFGRWANKNKLQIVSEDIAADELEILIDLLDNSGYDQYEVSNFCKPGFHSKHNSSYWARLPYLGVGPSAHSFNGHSRQYNIANNHLYIKNLKQNIIPSTIEILTKADMINDHLLTSLRTKKGCDLLILKHELDFDLLSVREDYLEQLIVKKLAILEDNVLVLTRSGILIADKIASDLFIEPDYV